MSDEDAKLLQQVRDWQPPKQLHPMAMAAWHIYEANDNKLDASTLDDIRGLFDTYLKQDDLEGLARAMEGGVRFMLYIGDGLGDEASARQFGELLRSYMPHFEPFWRKVAEAMENVGAAKSGAFSRFLDVDPAKTSAPKYGEKAPDGTFQVKNMMQPARPPPWMKKPR